MGKPREQWRSDPTRARQSNSQFYRPFTAFTNGIIFTWSKSLWKLVLPELAAWLILFGVISVIYRLIPRQHADHLEGFLQYCKNFQSLVPIGIIIGFYVTTMYGRWWAQWKEIPWIGKAAMLVHDVDNRDSLEGYLSRWTYLRWTLLGMAMTFQYCSKHFRESYPDLESLQELELVNAEEMEILKASPVRMELPYNWAGELIRRQERAGKNSYCSHKESRLLRENLVGWRNAMQALRGYDNHPVPMVWSQLMAFGVYTYYLVALFGRQYYLYKDDVPASTPLYLDKSPIDFYVPMLSMVEFVFYISLYKLAGMFYHPFSAHGCEHMLTRVLVEQISWGKQGAAFVHNGWMPPIDPSLVPKDPLLPPLPEDREEFPSDASEWRSVDEVNDEMAASFRAAARRQRAAAAAPDGSTEMQQLSSPLLSAAEVP